MSMTVEAGVTLWCSSSGVPYLNFYKKIAYLSGTGQVGQTD